MTEPVGVGSVGISLRRKVRARRVSRLSKRVKLYRVFDFVFVLQIPIVFISHVIRGRVRKRALVMAGRASSHISKFLVVRKLHTRRPLPVPFSKNSIFGCCEL